MAIGDVVKSFFWTMVKVAFVLVVIFMLLFGFLLLVAGKSVRRFLNWFCNFYLVGFLLMAFPIVLEVVGIITLPVGIGAVIAGVGLALEIIALICAANDGDWLGSGLSALGLVPVAGMPFQGAKGVRSLFGGGRRRKRPRRQRPARKRQVPRRRRPTLRRELK